MKSRSQVLRDGEKLGFGMLVKLKEDYEYLRHYISDNRPILQTCKELWLHNIEPGHHDEMTAHDVFNPNSGLFLLAVVISLLLIGVISLIGLIYEFVRWRKLGETQLSSSNTRIL